MISSCRMEVDSREREKIDHGTAMFPVAAYYDDMSRMPVPWHWHDEMEAGMIVEGELVLTAGTEKTVLSPGQGFFINSGVLHGAWDSQDSCCRFHSLVFHPRLIGGSVDSIFWQNYLQPVLESQSLSSLWMKGEESWRREAVCRIEEAWQAMKGEEPGYEFQVRDSLSRLIYLIWSHLSLEPSGKLSAGAVRSWERIKQMLRFIQENYSRDLDTRQIAASAMISESECLRCFHRVLGVTPIQYVKQLRIQKAADLLLSTSWSVSEIGVSCGFREMSYFAKTFRRIKGMTPSQYRRKDSI